jgi:hypothetical protein
MLPLGRLGALCDLACAALKGARAAQAAAAAQFGSFYEPWLPRGGAGWLAAPPVRDACMALAQQCLAACRSGAPDEWAERLLTLGTHLVARCAATHAWHTCMHGGPRGERVMRLRDSTADGCGAAC